MVSVTKQLENLTINNSESGGGGGGDSASDGDGGVEIHLEYFEKSDLLKPSITNTPATFYMIPNVD